MKAKRPGDAQTSRATTQEDEAPMPDKTNAMSELLSRPLPLPTPFDELEFVSDPATYGLDHEAMRYRIGDQRGWDLIDLRDCKSVVYIRDRDARGFLAFLAKKPVLSLDPAKVEAKRRATAERIAKEMVA